MTTIYDRLIPHQDNKRSQQLAECIQKAIMSHGGYLPFAHFMELCLYHPQYGYYHADRMCFGKEGDFTTAPEISPLFAKLFARQINHVLPQLAHGSLLEIGAGSGRFAFELLQALETTTERTYQYFIYEISVNLRQKQQKLLQEYYACLTSKVVWLDKLPSDFHGIIIANEVLDALPCHSFTIGEHDIYERCVNFNHDQFAWQLQPAKSSLKQEIHHLQNLHQLRSGYTSEINMALPPFIQALSRTLHQGIIFLVDYGYGAREYYHPERNQGTLTCFYQHCYHHNPLIYPGLQDMTCHVDFTRVITHAANCGFTLLGYTTQAAFLCALGLADLVQAMQQDLDEPDIFALNQAVKILTMPTEMGERVKIMGLGKNLDISLASFCLADRRREL